MLDQPKCENCRFFHRYDDRDVCRRYPPTPIVVGFAEWTDSGRTEPQITMRFPSVYCESWCGEHRPATKDEARPTGFGRFLVTKKA